MKIENDKHSLESKGINDQVNDQFIQRENKEIESPEHQEEPVESGQQDDDDKNTIQVIEKHFLGVGKSKWKTWIKLFTVFFRIGAFTFGGGLAMLPLIEHETVVKNKWIKHEEIVDVFAVAQSLPGVIALNSSIFVGYRVSGLVGALFAVMGMIVPSFVTILLIAVFFNAFQENPWVLKALAGVRAGVAGIILLAVIRLGKKILKSPAAIFLGILSFLLIGIFSIHAGWVVLGGAFAGLLLQMSSKKTVEQSVEK